jgi:hypothetical protein
MPGGFAARYRAHGLQRAASPTARSFAAPDALLLSGAVAPLVDGRMGYGVAIGLMLAAIVAGNEISATSVRRCAGGATRLGW